MLNETTRSTCLAPPRTWAGRGESRSAPPALSRAPSSWGLCCRHHVPQVVRVVGSLPHRLGRVPVLLLPWETELRVHQLLQHPSLQRAPAQETEQLCLGPAARAPRHRPAPAVSAPPGSLLKVKGMLPPPASFFGPHAPSAPQASPGCPVVLGGEGRVFSFSSSPAKRARCKTFFCKL